LKKRSNLNVLHWLGQGGAYSRVCFCQVEVIDDAAIGMNVGLAQAAYVVVVILFAIFMTYSHFTLRGLGESTCYFQSSSIFGRLKGEGGECSLLFRYCYLIPP
jgi:hypothetical protein